MQLQSNFKPSKMVAILWIKGREAQGNVLIYLNKSGCVKDIAVDGGTFRENADLLYCDGIRSIISRINEETTANQLANVLKASGVEIV